MGALQSPRHLHSRTERTALRARRRRRRAGLAVVVAAAVAALAAVAAGLPQQAVRQDPDAGGRVTAEAGAVPPQSTTAQTFPVNGGFDRGMTGWEASAGAVVSWQTTGHVGGSALVRANPGSPPGTSRAAPDATVTGLVARDAAPPAAAGVELQGSAWVRGSTPALVVVRLVERAGDQEVAAGRAQVQLAGQWRQVTVAHTVTRAGTQVDLEVLAVNLPAGATVGIDSAEVTVAN